MREIKFRGKRVYPIVDEPLLVYGQFEWDAWHNPRIINEHGAFEIDGETLGQYTGLKDRNGKEIYEGDVIRFATEDGFTLAYIIFDSGDEGNIFVSGFVAKEIRDITDEVCEEGYLLNGWDGETEVIGNIYLNPEFLMSAGVE